MCVHCLSGVGEIGVVISESSMMFCVPFRENNLSDLHMLFRNLRKLICILYWRGICWLFELLVLDLI